MTEARRPKKASLFLLITLWNRKPSLYHSADQEAKFRSLHVGAPLGKSNSISHDFISCMNRPFTSNVRVVKHGTLVHYYCHLLICTPPSKNQPRIPPSFCPVHAVHSACVQSAPSKEKMLNLVKFEPYDLFDFANVILRFYHIRLAEKDSNIHAKTTIGQSNRIFPKRIERTPTESRSSLVTHPSRARSGTFASGNLD